MKYFQSKSNTGFTLLEAVLYLAIAGTVLYFISGFAFNSIFGKAKIETFQNINQNSQSVLDELSNTIGNSEGVNGFIGNIVPDKPPCFGRDPTDVDCWSVATSSLIWGPTGVTGVQSTTNGAANTATLAGLTGYPAADYCANLIENGYDDWYLPSIDELMAGWGALGLGGFPNDVYWSSTESSGGPETSAWDLLTFLADMGGNYKGSEYSVRCLR